MRRQRKFLARFSVDGDIRPPLVRGPLRLVFGCRPTDGDLPDAWPVAAGVAIRGDGLRIGARDDEAVAKLAGLRGGLGPAGGKVDPRQALGERVQPRVLDREVASAMVRQLALPELADHLDRFFEHLGPDLEARPATAHHMLVEVLAGAESEEEPVWHQRGGRRGGLGDDRRMGPDGRTRDAGAEDQTVGRLRDRSEDAPDEGALALAADPRVEMVRDESEREARLLGGTCVRDEVFGG